MTKFGNVPTVLYGVEFSSRAEAWYYPVLLERLEAGEIKDLHIQPRYELLPAFTHGSGGRKRVTERPIHYVGDFDFVEVVTGKRVVIDVKGGKANRGTQTAVFKLKAKLFRYKYPDIELRIVEVG